jgi:hypothetical protein
MDEHHEFKSQSERRECQFFFLPYLFFLLFTYLIITLSERSSEAMEKLKWSYRLIDALTIKLYVVFNKRDRVY